MARPDAERDDRLAERDDHDQRVPLGEVAGGEAPALAASDVGAEQVEPERERPHSHLETTVEAGGQEQEPDANRRPHAEPGDCLEQVAVAPPGDRVEHEMRDPNEGVRAREEEGVVAEDVRHRQ